MTPRCLLTAAVAMIVAQELRAQTLPSDSAERASVVNFYRRWSAATATEGATGYARFFAADAVLLPPDHAPVISRDSIRAWQEDVQKTATHVTRPTAISQDEIRIEGALAITRTTLKGTRTPKAGGDAVPFQNKIFDVLRRNPNVPDGWEFMYRMWSSDLPPRP